MAAFLIFRAATSFMFLYEVVSQSCPTDCSCTLDTIDCSGRGFTRLPDVEKPFARTTRFSKIDFSSNILAFLDIDKLFEFIQGSEVDVLDFSDNEIQFINGTFDAADGKDFETLNLSRNFLSEFPRKIVPINHFRGKYVVDISYNRLAELRSRMFADGRDSTLPDFEFRATNNMISRIAADAFQGVALIKAIIDVRSNFLRSIPETFRPPRDTEELWISDNPWNCSCDLRWIINPSNRLVNFTAIDPPDCQTPAAVQGRPIFGLKADDFACLPYRNGPVRQNFNSMSSIIVRCPVTADPPRFVITWQVWIPISGSDETVQLFFESETVGLREIQANPRAAFQCTASNNAGSITVPLDIRYNNVPGIEVPECPAASAPDVC